MVRLSSRPSVAHRFQHSLLCLAALCLVAPAGAQLGSSQTDGSRSNYTMDPTRDLIKATRLEQKLDAQVPLDIPFRDETGKVVPLSTFIKDKPVMLVMPFYQCTGVCTLELNGMIKAFKSLRFKPGKEFDVVIVSINPKEGPELAASKKQSYLAMYGHPETANGWHFLTGEEANIQRLAQAVGFHYIYDAEHDRYSHPAGLMVITPQGKLSRYFYGSDYSPRDMRFALMEASENHIGSVVEEIQLYCFHYDPVTGKYGLVITRIIQLAGAATVLILGSFIFLMLRYERRQNRATLPPKSQNQMPADLP